MTNKIHPTLLPALRYLSDGVFHSGQEMAHHFDLSRSSIFNLIRLAQSLGIVIYSVRGKGYQLPRSDEWLSSDAVEQHLGALADSFDILIVDSVESTNSSVMLGALNGAPDGSVVCTEFQHAGKGRRGRPWLSVLGGSLTFSVLYRFDKGLQSMAGLSLAVGLAVARAINRHSQYPALLKWPNDVLVGYRKIAGILVEVQGDMHGAAFAVIGVGINTKLSAGQRDSIDQAVVDLAELGVTVNRNELLADCLKELHEALSVFKRSGFSALREEWMLLDAYAGKAVSLMLPNTQAAYGVVAGVDMTGALMLHNEQGEVTTYCGGEVSLRLR